MQRDAGCTIVEPTRGDRQRAWGMGLLWQLKGAHMTSKHTEVSQGEGEKNLICSHSHSHGISWRIRGWSSLQREAEQPPVALTSSSSSSDICSTEGRWQYQCGSALLFILAAINAHHPKKKMYTSLKFNQVSHSGEGF